LVEVNTNDVEDTEDFGKRVAGATYLASLQATYTNFNYLRPVWKKTTDKEALIGVGLTGITSNRIPEDILNFSANMVGLGNSILKLTENSAARCTVVKPSGTASLVLGCSSGIHPWHSEYYIRRITLNKSEEIYEYLKDKLPELVEDSLTNKNEAFILIPQKAPEGASVNESLEDIFNRVILYNKTWIKGGHRSGKNYNNVSATLPVKEDEWDFLEDKLWEHREDYAAISFFPYEEHTYPQLMLETCDKEKYEELMKYVQEIDLTKVHEKTDYTDLTGEIACAGGVCEIV
jgi:ribonucleoside-diphosphate reductase alpha chain